MANQSTGTDVVLWYAGPFLYNGQTRHHIKAVISVPN